MDLTPPQPNGEADAAAADAAPAAAPVAEPVAEPAALVPTYADLFPALPEGPSAAVLSTQHTTWANSALKSKHVTEVSLSRLLFVEE